MGQGQSRGKRGNKKHGRAKTKCQRYLLANRREKNKVRKLSRLLRKAEKYGWGNVDQLRTAIGRAKDKICGV